MGVVRCGLQRATDLCLKIRCCRTVLAHTVNRLDGADCEGIKEQCSHWEIELSVCGATPRVRSSLAPSTREGSSLDARAAMGLFSRRRCRAIGPACKRSGPEVLKAGLAQGGVARGMGQRVAARRAKRSPSSIISPGGGRRCQILRFPQRSSGPSMQPRARSKSRFERRSGTGFPNP